MSDQEPSIIEARPRAVLWLVRSLPPEPRQHLVTSALFETPGLRLTREALEAGGRTYALKELTGFRTRRAPPRLSLPLVLAGVGVTLALPVVLARQDFGPSYAAFTGIIGLVLAALLYLLVAGDRYGLILRTAEGDREVFQTSDPHRIACVVEALDAVLVKRLPELPRVLHPRSR